MAVIKGGLKIGSHMEVSDVLKLRKYFPRFAGLKGKEIVSEEKEEVPDLDSMKKDELNDYAAKKGYEKEIKSSMKKKSMVEKLKYLLGFKGVKR